MPKEWYDRNSNRDCDIADEEKRHFNLRIIADKKPYFMRYIYPTLMRQYNTYIANTNKKSLREFRLTIDELMAKPEELLTVEERDFIRYYHAKMPVGVHNCVMNRICRRFEQEFDGYIMRSRDNRDFDYRVMTSGQEYTARQYNAVLRLYDAYNRRLQEFMQSAKKERVDEDESASHKNLMAQEFMRECLEACPNGQQLCDILLDICYQREGTKQFVWDMAGEEIVANLLAKNGGEISYPVRDDGGDILFGGERFLYRKKLTGGYTDGHRAE